ncbi:MAG TPA: NADH:ubiquinone reductase (Na(+)-transporting) subunit C [Prolixibacteraceae bacterium]|nr:NADH:ubiquinone reductase (Na(+)-transporting) subunit C [Prolixibacteraceae bacterium]HPR60774.1 NADH:ubiquinone reductase (Na(+)-transporting) subunit C [Prolixibacteraceae bacterium]
MNRNGNTYTFIYASVMVIIVAAILSFTAMSLKPLQKRNIEVEKKKNILTSININASTAEAEKIYDQTITNSYVVNSKGELVEGNAFTIDLKKEHAKALEERVMPVFEANMGEQGTKYVIPLRGTGLWGPIWGYVALNSDLNTIFGATFDHQGETPGLGAEIVTPAFQEVFKGKELFDNNGKFVSLVVAKAGEVAPAQHKVDAISGGTITSKGLQQMLYDDLSGYVEFFNKKKTE